MKLTFAKYSNKLPNHNYFLTIIKKVFYAEYEYGTEKK